MSRKFAYLTIDDSPSKDFSQKLHYLITKNIPAIWFCTGANLAQYPERAIDAIQHGYIIGNHSYTHPHFSDISVEIAFDEIRRTDNLIDELYAQAGIMRPAKYFRFPYGDKGSAECKAVLQLYLRELGYVQPAFPGVSYAYYREQGLLEDVDWYWTYDCMEWTVHKPEPMHGINCLEKVFERMDENVPDGGRGLNDTLSEEIILLHDHEQTTDFFRPIIDRLLEKGIEFRPIPLLES